MVGLGALSDRAWKCGPIRITFLGKTAFCSGTYLSGIPGITRIIIWSWGAYTVLTRGRINTTLGGACIPPYVHPRSLRGKMKHSWIIDGRSQSNARLRGGYPNEYSRNIGASLMPLYPSVDNQYNIWNASGHWGGRSRHY